MRDLFFPSSAQQAACSPLPVLPGALPANPPVLGYHSLGSCRGPPAVPAAPAPAPAPAVAAPPAAELCDPAASLAAAERGPLYQGLLDVLLLICAMFLPSLAAAERDPLHQGLIVQRANLQARDYQIDLAAKLNKTQVVSLAMPLSQQVRRTGSFKWGLGLGAGGVPLWRRLFPLLPFLSCRGAGSLTSCPELWYGRCGAAPLICLCLSSSARLFARCSFVYACTPPPAPSSPSGRLLLLRVRLHPARLAVLPGPHQRQVAQQGAGHEHEGGEVQRGAGKWLAARTPALPAPCTLPALTSLHPSLSASLSLGRSAAAGGGGCCLKAWHGKVRSKSSTVGTGTGTHLCVARHLVMHVEGEKDSRERESCCWLHSQCVCASLGRACAWRGGLLPSNWRRDLV